MNETTAPQQEKGGQTGTDWWPYAACLVLAVVAIVLGVKAHHLNVQLADTQAQLISMKSETSQVLSDLDKTRAASADLQAQLDKAKAACGDFQSQFEKAKASCGDLQAQLDKAAADGAKQVADLQAKLVIANAQSAGLKAQLDQANAKSSQLAGQLALVQGQSTALQAQVKKDESDLAKLKPYYDRARQLPVKASIVQSSWDRTSYTLTVTNLRFDPLKVDVTTCEDGTEKTQTSVIAKGGTLEIGKLSAGCVLTIASEGFDPMYLTVR